MITKESNNFQKTLKDSGRFQNTPRTFQNSLSYEANVSRRANFSQESP